MILTSVSDVALVCGAFAGVPMGGLLLFHDGQERWAMVLRVAARIDTACTVIGDIVGLFRDTLLRIWFNFLWFIHCTRWWQFKRNPSPEIDRWFRSECGRIARLYVEVRTVRMEQARRMSEER